MSDNSTLLIGFPETGKSTYLAALYNYVTSTLPGISLSQYKSSLDAEYLNKIHQKWISFEIPGRTIQESANRNVELFLKDSLTSRKFTLNIPDIEGEVIKHQWELRGWRKEYMEMVKKATGLVFFINTCNLNNHLLISDVPGGLAELSGLDPDEEVSVGTLRNLQERWTSDKTPTQVRVIEILQFHLDIILKQMPIPIAFVLSAWDKQIDPDHEIQPTEWIKVNLPMLFQYLEANPESIVYKVFGVSAQGGDYDIKDEKAKLVKMNEPADRVKVAVDGEPVSNNIAYPICWILEKWTEQNL